jgi:hypothetical protein
MPVQGVEQEMRLQLPLQQTQAQPQVVGLGLQGRHRAAPAHDARRRCRSAGPARHSPSWHRSTRSPHSIARTPRRSRRAACRATAAPGPPPAAWRRADRRGCWPAMPASGGPAAAANAHGGARARATSRLKPICGSIIGAITASELRKPSALPARCRSSERLSASATSTRPQNSSTTATSTRSAWRWGGVDGACIAAHFRVCTERGDVHGPGFVSPRR